MKIAFNFKSPNPSPSPLYISSPEPPSLRVADILLHDQSDAVSEEMSLIGNNPREDPKCNGCSSPRRIVSRWLSLLRRLRVKGAVRETGKREKEEQIEDGDRVVPARCLMNGDDGVDSVVTVNSAPGSGVSGQCRKEDSFNLGVGCCLLYLVAASKTELSKMVELRMQMENLLQNTKEELQKKQEISAHSETNGIFYYSTTDARESPDLETQLSSQVDATTSIMPESSSATACNQYLKCEMSKQEECVEGMDQLEAELQAELERLQLRLDAENLLRHHQLPWLRELRVTVEDDTTPKSHSASSGEVVDPEEANMEVHCGVPPHELERRLHEVLETRQGEQIRELEAVIEFLKQKLHEKEMEASWWKDTARLVSQHVTEKPLRFTSQHNPKTYITH